MSYFRFTRALLVYIHDIARGRERARIGSFWRMPPVAVQMPDAHAVSCRGNAEKSEKPHPSAWVLASLE